MKKIVLIIFSLLFLSACSVGNWPQIADFDWSSFLKKKEVEGYLVERVIDGDTIKVKKGKEILTIRLIGLDTPEIVDPRKTVECFAREASDKANEILKGQIVHLEEDSSQGDKDKYQRLLRYVFLEDGTLFNQWMIENGYGHEYTYSTPYKYQAEFKAAEKKARENSLGLWAEDACHDFDSDLENLVETMSEVWEDLKDIFLK